ncbi:MULTISPECIES: aspartate aminotransferase family protein [unclassified Mesorhizobium]|uniref:aspartate aminotransferase family protein n=1 Tax=unclassified Mesorhizobium TaxID=325217 RepID=UPI0016786AFE|nr:MULTISPECIES: aspartate aminotransferase family protein [unclassified Mesorhizobium]
MAAGVSSNARLLGKRPPLLFRRARGSELTDVNGNRYIDYVMGMGPMILGHRPLTIETAIIESFETGQLFGGQSPLEAQLAAKIVDSVPCAELVRFTNTGTEADLLAVRLARAFTGRPRIIKFEGHYHGWGDGLAVNIRPPLAQAERRNAVQTQPESLGMTPSSYDDVIVLPWNDLDAIDACLNWQGQSVAGVIMEPVMCNNGVITPSPGYLEKVRELCTASGALLIFDEVITGFRLAPGGAQEKFGVTPDLAIFGKALAAGVPMGCVAGRADVMEMLTKGVMHGGTYSGNCTALSVGLATLEQTCTRGGQALKTLDAMGNQLIERLEESLKRHEIDGQVQGYGAHFGLFFAPPERRIQNLQDLRLVDRDAGDEFVARMLDAGVRVTNRASFFLSTAHTSSDIQDAADAADAILAEMARQKWAA